MRTEIEGKKISACQSVSNMELSVDGRHMRYLIREKMARMIAQHIVNSEIVEDRRDHHTSFRMELFVLTLEELHRLIHDEAMRLSRLMNLSSMTDNTNREKE